MGVSMPYVVDKTNEQRGMEQRDQMKPLRLVLTLGGRQGPFRSQGT